MMNIDKMEERWSECPFGDYLNAVDEYLDELAGRSSEQDELRFIAECQEALCLPVECAEGIIEGNWV